MRMISVISRVITIILVRDVEFKRAMLDQVHPFNIISLPALNVVGVPRKKYYKATNRSVRFERRLHIHHGVCESQPDSRTDPTRTPISRY